MDSDTETMVDTDLDSAERDLQMPNPNLMPKLNLMPMLILMLGTVKDLESMVGLAKDMLDTEAMVFNKQYTDSEVIPIMVRNLSSRNELCSIPHSSYSIEQY